MDNLKMPDPLRDRCEALIAELGLGRPADLTEVRSLTGGVASDIAMVDLAGRRMCIKFALPKLKVAEDWQAPVHRNRAEYEWLSVAARIAPENAVRTYGRSQTLHGFAMEFIDGPDVVLWKADLLAGRGDAQRAAAVATLLGKIHQASVSKDFNTAAFQNRDDFNALRLEPYLTFTAQKHENVAPSLNQLAEEMYRSEKVLVHGDVSPKNILFKGGRPFLLDAECATMGAPEFDVAFCLNHLVLKAQHVPVLRVDLALTLKAFWQAYQVHASWEAASDLEARVCRLLPALMLARIDGKSPVEYLSEQNRTVIREASLALLIERENTLEAIARRLSTIWKDEIR